MQSYRTKMDVAPRDFSTRAMHDTYTIGHLTKQLQENRIGKPYHQRKKVWTIKEDREWIIEIIKEGSDILGFLINRKDGLEYIWDGNNRMNAIHSFKRAPLKMFPEFIETFFGKVPKEVTAYLQQCTYQDIMKKKDVVRLLKDAPEPCKAWYEENREQFQEDENGFDKLKAKFQLWDIDSIKISVMIWDNATDEEMTERYTNRNRGGVKLTPQDILAASTHKIRYKDKELGPYAHDIRTRVEDYYQTGNENEVLKVEFDGKEPLNLFQILLGFQQFLHDKYPIVVPPTDSETTYDLLFDLYKYITGDATFTQQNLNMLDFLTKIHGCVEHVHDICSMFGDSHIKNKAINPSKKGSSSACIFKKNNILRILTVVYKNYEKVSTKDREFKKQLLIVIYVSEIIPLAHPIDKSVGDRFHDENPLTYKSGGTHIPNCMSDILKTGQFHVRPSRDTVEKLLKILIEQEIYPQEFEKKARKTKYSKFVKMLMNLVYNGSVPPSLRDKKCDDLDHIIPWSAEWNGRIDINRIGNMAAIDEMANKEKGNRAITDEFIQQYLPYYKYPSEAEYNLICEETKKKRGVRVVIRDSDAYNAMCERREKYIMDKALEIMF